MWCGQRRRRRSGGRVVYSFRRAGITGFKAAAIGFSFVAALPAHAGQLPASAFQVYNPANASSIQAGPFALYTVPVDQLQPTQMNEGFTEVNAKTNGFNLLLPSQLNANLLGDIEPVVIGPGGVLYLTDGHHTFTALENSSYGSTDPVVYVNVIANYSNLTTAQFFAQMQASDLLLPLNDGVPQVVNTATGAPIPTSLTGLTQDPYRGLEYSILKNKSSKLFKTTANITGAVGSAIPGLDKVTGLYSDFIWADAYRNANGGRGLPYLSPGDIALATQWNLNGNSVTTMPNIGTVTVAQLPGYILGQNLPISTTISNATLSTGTLDGNGGFTGITSFNLGTASNPIMVGTPQSGFVMQLGSDAGFSVTLSGANTYTGGTTIIAGNLIINSDAALGAAAPANYTINPNNILASVEAANGIIFNSLTEGNGTLTFANSFSTNRPIAVDGEAATINPNGHTVTLSGQIVSLGTNGVGISNANGESDLTVNDQSTLANGAVILPASSNNSGFYGNWIITAGTLNVSSDASLGNTTGPSYTIGQIELNGGILQAGASFNSVRSLFLGGGSTYDTNGYTTSWAGSLTDVQRTLTVENSNSTTLGAVTFGSFNVSATATLALAGGAAGETVTFTNGIVRNGNATVFIDPSTTTSLGNTEKVFSTAAPTLVNGIAPAWIITDSGGSASSNPYNFVTYGANGYVAATYTDSGSGSSGGIRTATATSIVDQTGNATLAANAQAYALKVNDGSVITATGFTITLGNGTNPAGLIMDGGSAAINGGTLQFNGSEAVIYAKGTSYITSTLAGTGGLTVSGSGTLVLSGAAGQLSGPVVINSGTLTLNTANYFPTSGTSIWLSDVKSHPSMAVLAFNQSQTIAELNSAGSNSYILIDSTGGTVNGVVGSTSTKLTVGNSTYQTLSSSIIQTSETTTPSSSITPSGTAVSGIITKVGSGVLDISGGSVALVSGSTINVNDGALRIGNGVFSTTATNAIIVASGAELQYSGNGGSAFNDPIQGAGVFHLISGTVQLTGTNTYTGGTVLEVGTTLDVTTANLPANAAISNAGGILVFDQSTSGTFTGVMSDGKQAGGSTIPTTSPAPWSPAAARLCLAR